MENSKYLVRPSDFCIFEIDESNGCYRVYEKSPHPNRQNAYKHFTYDNLVNHIGFFPITEDKISYYEKRHTFEIKFMSWQCRNDGHGGCKGGTRKEYLEYLKRVEEFKNKQK